MKTTTTYAERIKIIIENERLNPTSFSKRAGFTNNVTILKILEENRKPIKSTLDKINKAFPQYNYRWLLTGDGDMLNTDEEIVVRGDNNTVNADLTNCERELQLKTEQIKQLKEQLSFAKEQLKSANELLHSIVTSTPKKH